jgi:hypothetical protein
MLKKINFLLTINQKYGKFNPLKLSNKAVNKKPDTIQTMQATHKKTVKKWLNIWEKAESALYAIKIKELRADNYYQKNQDLINAMLKYAFDHRTVRLNSGLVEQQKIFMKYYQNNL